MRKFGRCKKCGYTENNLLKGKKFDENGKPTK